MPEMQTEQRTKREIQLLGDLQRAAGTIEKMMRGMTEAKGTIQGLMTALDTARHQTAMAQQDVEHERLKVTYYQGVAVVCAAVAVVAMVALGLAWVE